MPGLPGIRQQTVRPPGKKNRGRAGRQGSRAHASLRRVRKQGCSDPRASTPRDIEACRVSLSASLRSLGGSARHAASPPNPRRPARGVCRLAPHRPRWAYLFTHRCGPRRGRRTFDRFAGAHHQRGPVTRGRRAGTKRLGPPGHDTASPMHGIPRPPLPAPRLETLIRHPSVTGRDKHRKTYLRNIVEKIVHILFFALRHACSIDRAPCPSSRPTRTRR